MGRRVALPDHFIDVVIIEDARPLGSGAELRVRQANAELDEAVLSPEYLCKNRGSRPHESRNGLGWAVPAADQVEQPVAKVPAAFERRCIPPDCVVRRLHMPNMRPPHALSGGRLAALGATRGFTTGCETLRRAVRYQLAIERVRDWWCEHNLTDAQTSQLKERASTEQAAAESSLFKLYDEVWLPSTGEGALSLDVVGVGGRPLQTTLDDTKRAQIHQRLMELLTTVQRRIFGTVAPGKIVELFRLGTDESSEPGGSPDTVVAGFFSFLGFPRLQTDDVVCKAIARGVETGLFGYATGQPELGDDGRYRLDRSRIAFDRAVADDEIDLDAGFLILPAALPERPVVTTVAAGGASTGQAGSYSETGGETTVREKPDAGDDWKPALEAADIEAVQESYGPDCFHDDKPSVVLRKGYSNALAFSGLNVDDEKAIRHLVKSAGLPDPIATTVLACTSVSEMTGVLANGEQTEAVRTLTPKLQEVSDHDVAHVIQTTILRKRIPGFLYFDEYYQMKGQDNLDALRNRLTSNALEDPDNPLLGLISLAGLDLDKLVQPGKTQALAGRSRVSHSQTASTRQPRARRSASFL